MNYEIRNTVTGLTSIIDSEQYLNLVGNEVYTQTQGNYCAYFFGFKCIVTVLH